MGQHGFEVLGGHFLKAHKHLDFFVENFDFPPKPIRNEDLPRLSFQIIAGEVFSTAFWPFFEFGANQLDLSHITEVGNDLSYAKLHSPFVRITGRDPNGYPFYAAMILEKGLHLGPSSG
jgi:hypothetical protein